MKIEFCKERFAFLAERSLFEEKNDIGIGTLGEKAVHRTVKSYIEPRSECRECKVLGFVADILNENGIFEVQTRSFEKLAKKIETALQKYPVTVVYPLVREKKICWLSPDTGEIAETKKSPKHEYPCNAVAELSKIGEFIGKENFTVCLVFISAEEYRLLDGWDKSRKKRATKYNIFPKELLEIVEIKEIEDLYKLVPENLPEKFEAKDFYKRISRKGRGAFYALKFMVEKGIFYQVGKRSNAKIYKVNVDK